MLKYFKESYKYCNKMSDIIVEVESGPVQAAPSPMYTTYTARFPSHRTKIHLPMVVRNAELATHKANVNSQARFNLTWLVKYFQTWANDQKFPLGRNCRDFLKAEKLSYAKFETDYDNARWLSTYKKEIIRDSHGRTYTQHSFRFPNDGFIYDRSEHKATRSHNVKRHDGSSTWCSLELKEFAAELTPIRQWLRHFIGEENGDKQQCFYNYEEERIDYKLIFTGDKFPHLNNKRDVVCLVAFELGYPVDPIVEDDWLED